MPPPKKTAATRPSRKSRNKVPAEPKLSRSRPPEDMSAVEWQIRLRRQFGREQSFMLENIGDEPVFSEFFVTNPDRDSRYRVAIRGVMAGENFCSCPDFATNGLGTCKHIEFTLARIETRRGGKTALKAGFHPSYSEIYLHYGEVRSLRFRTGSDCPPAQARRAAKLFDWEAGGILRDAQFAALDAFVAAAQKAGHEVRCYQDALAFMADLRDTEARHRALDHAFPEGAQSPALAALLKTPLYPYQAAGALFAARAGRALIGDEMGLGKTIQAIAAAELLSRHCGVQRVLIVCPTSLKHQWQREIERFSTRGAQVIHGLRAMRQRQYQDECTCKITNYETLARDLDLIAGWSPDLVIVDEAQRVKNWNTIAARALKRIESPYAIVLTGTPLENRLEELISIVQFVDQHRLGPTWRLLHAHQIRDEAGRVIGYRDLDRIGATLAPIMLRRRKAEVLTQLPARVDNTLFVPMSAQQIVYHDENGETVRRIVQRWRKTGFLSDADQRRLTCALQNMRMSCNSTYLLDHETDHGTKADELATLLDEWFEQPDAKVVIFSQWRRTHELIIRRLEARGLAYVLFHGGVPSEKRQALVDRFRDDPDCRIFLSTDAGGVGLNLQHAAATIVNMDLPWNPAVLEQRIGRVHRLGQTRSVQVVNFVAKGTIEEGMLSVLAFKKSLFAGVLDGGETAVFMNGTRLSKFMESVDQVTGAMDSAEPMAEITDTGAEPNAASAQNGQQAETQGADDLTQAAIPQPERPGAPANGVPAADPWAALIDVGLKLAETIAAAHAGNGSEQTKAASPWVETDAQTGKSYLKLPMPEPETVQRLAGALAGLLAGLQRR